MDNSINQSVLFKKKNQSISQPHLHLALKENLNWKSFKLDSFFTTSIKMSCGQTLLNDIFFFFEKLTELYIYFFNRILNDILIGHVKEILQFSYDFDAEWAIVAFNVCELTALLKICSDY